MGSLDSGRELAENKLILLYILNRVDMPVSNLQMTKLILENKLMNYFILQQYILELLESSFISLETIDGKSFYRVTENGRQTLGYFLGLIPPGIKARIDNMLAMLRNDIRNEISVLSEYIPQNEKEYLVKCSVCEGSFTLIELNVTVGTKQDARTICSNWQKYSQAIYAEIIESLTEKRDGKDGD